MKYWIGTVSQEHVLRGVAGGFCQVCHGKAAPLNRMKRGDWLLYYSPKISLYGHEKWQAFTACGQIADDTAYPFRMSEDFIPFRRNVVYSPIQRDCPLDIARTHPEWKMYATDILQSAKIFSPLYRAICSRRLKTGRDRKACFSRVCGK